MGMKATIVHDLILKQGATYREELETGLGVEDPPGTWTIETPDDWSGCIGRMQIRKKYGSPVLLEVTTTPTSLGSLTLTGNVTTIWLSDEGTDLLIDPDTGKVATKCKYDLEVEYPSGDVDRTFEGDVLVSPNITRDVP